MARCMMWAVWSGEKGVGSDVGKTRTPLTKLSDGQGCSLVCGHWANHVQLLTYKMLKHGNLFYSMGGISTLKHVIAISRTGLWIAS